MEINFKNKKLVFIVLVSAMFLSLSFSSFAQVTAGADVTGQGTFDNPFVSSKVDSGNIGVWVKEGETQCKVALRISGTWTTNTMPSSVKEKFDGTGTATDPFRPKNGNRGLACVSNVVKVMYKSGSAWSETAPSTSTGSGTATGGGSTSGGSGSTGGSTSGGSTSGGTTPLPPTGPVYQPPSGSGCTDNEACRSIDKAFQKAMQILSPQDDVHRQSIWDPQTTSKKKIWEIYPDEVNPDAQKQSTSQNIPPVDKLRETAQTALEKSMVEAWASVNSPISSVSSQYSVTPSMLLAVVHELNKDITPIGSPSACGEVGLMQLSPEVAVQLGLKLQFKQQPGEDLSSLNNFLNDNPGANNIANQLNVNGLLVSNPACTRRPSGAVPVCNSASQDYCDRSGDERFNAEESLTVAAQRLARSQQRHNNNWEESLKEFLIDFQPITYTAAQRQTFATNVIAAEEAFRNLFDRQALLDSARNYWRFKPGVENQLNDASLELLQFMKCMEGQLDSGVTRITSISGAAGLLECQTNYEANKCDKHTPNSAHFGCSSKYPGSLSVDFGFRNDASTPEDSCIIGRAIDNCRSQVEISAVFGPDKYARFGEDAQNQCSSPKPRIATADNHEDHVHVSVKSRTGVSCG